MRIRTLLTSFALCAVGVAACSGNGEHEPPPGDPSAEPGTTAPGQELDPEAIGLMLEVRRIHARLAPVQEEAIRDPGLVLKLENVRRQVDDAMREERPEVFNALERLEVALRTAREAGDGARAQEVWTEAQASYEQLQPLQRVVLGRPGIRELVRDFERSQRERMIEIDPEVETDLERLQEITREIEERGSEFPDG